MIFNHKYTAKWNVILLTQAQGEVECEFTHKYTAKWNVILLTRKYMAKWKVVFAAT